MSGARSRDPASAADDPARRHGDGPPPAAPRELPRAAVEARQFMHENVCWVSWLSGRSAWGTGAYGLGLVEAVHFAHADSPTTPLYEALLARSRFEWLYDSELVELLRSAKPIDVADSR
jgi:hypothetical protein